MRSDRNLSLQKKVSLELRSLRSLGAARRAASIRMMPGHHLFSVLRVALPVDLARPAAAMPRGTGK